MVLSRSIFLAVLMLAACSWGNATTSQTQKTYFIGNSLTMSTTLDRVHRLFEQRGIDLQFGGSLSSGKSLIRHLNYKSEPQHKWNFWETDVVNGETLEPNPDHWSDRDPRFGLWDQAIPDYDWDQLVMQLYRSNLHDDLEALSSFIDLAVTDGSVGEFLIYSTWPSRPSKRGENGKRLKEFNQIDYAGVWTAAYTASVDDTSWGAGKNYASRDYVDQLFSRLLERYPTLSIRLIPVGEVLFRIDEMIRKDELPELWDLAEREPSMLSGLQDTSTAADGVNLLYADGIHFNPMPHKSSSLGIFISGTTVFTVLSGQSPVGMSGSDYGLNDSLDADLIHALQEVIWQVVTEDSRSGVK